MAIHSTAIVSSEVELGSNVEIGPYCIIQGKVVIGNNTSIGSHSVIEGNTKIGNDCRLHPHVSIGLPPQDISFQGEDTKVVIGNGVVLREFCSVHKGTQKGRGETIIGDRCYLMNYVHVGHDCTLKNDIIIANGTQIGGHVTISEKANISAFFLAHQFIEVGKLCMISGMSGARKSIPPYVLIEGRPVRIMKVNTIGLQRAGYSSDEIKQISRSYQLLRKKETRLAIEEIKEIGQNFPAVLEVADFYERALDSRRGIIPFYSVDKERISNALSVTSLDD